MFKKEIIKIFKLISSIKIAILILLLIAFFSALSTFVVQGQVDQYYIDNYGKIGNLILYTNYHNFFRSQLFIVLMFLFFINLLSCTIKRLYKEFTKQIKLMFGPDLIHLSLLLLIIGGILNIIWEEKAVVTLKSGDVIKVEEYNIILKDFIYEQYDNGSPKDWISVLDVSDTLGNEILNEKRIEVNKPLRLKNIAIYQSSYVVINRVELKSDDGQKYLIESGYSFQLDNETYILQDVIPGNSCFFEVIDSNNNSKFYKYEIGSKIKNYTVENSFRDMSSGLLIKKEPGYFLNYSALIIMLLGFILTYIEKIVKKGR